MVFELKFKLTIVFHTCKYLLILKANIFNKETLEKLFSTAFFQVFFFKNLYLLLRYSLHFRFLIS